jgi:uncharacterized protein (DUF2141 family)
MMRYFIVFGILLSFILSTSCAKRGFIDGGPKDTIAPILVSSKPENFSTNFVGNDIRIIFDEYIKLKDVDKQLIISPPLKNKPDISPVSASKYINIRLRDTLKENTTYSFNFGQSIQDNNEGNPFQSFTYVMSTGSAIDSLTLKGRIKDAYLNKTDDFVSVYLYDINDKFSDSVVYKSMPRYATNTLNQGNDYEFKYLKPGQYKLVALKDKNNNFKFDPKNEKIGFHSDVITIPNDTLYEVELFQEKIPFKTLNATLTHQNKIEVGFEGKQKDAKFELKNGNETIKTWLTKPTDKDTLMIWFKPLTVDSLQLHIKKDDFKKTQNIIVRKKEIDSLKLSPMTGILKFREDLFINSSTPLAKIDDSKISIRDKDSLEVKFTHFYNEEKQKLEFYFKKEPEQSYHALALPGAITDIFDKTNDSLKFAVNTKRLADFGNLVLNLNNVKSYPLIIDLLNDKGDIQTTFWVKDKDQKIEFKLLDPIKYTVRFIYDTNGNGEWDTGSYVDKRQTEEVLYFPTPVDVRMNWDVNQNIDLGG